MRNKKLLLAVFIFTSALNAQAQVPQGINYQAVARNAAGLILANKHISVRFTITNGNGGTTLYREHDTTTTNQFGLFTHNIGSGTADTLTLSSISWGTVTPWLMVEMDPTGNTSYINMGSSQLLSVPYALYAKTAATHYIGELYGGGIVFHVYKDSLGNEHGMIVSLSDLSTAAKWGLDSTNVPNCSSTWNGLANSNAILTAGCLTTDAEGLCKAYNGGGFNDWYLPSIDELNLIYNVRYNLNKVLNSASGGTEIGRGGFWSSTADLNYSAYHFVFNAGIIEATDRYVSQYVRAVRAF